MDAEDLSLGIDGSHELSVYDVHRLLADWVVGQTITVSLPWGRERASLHSVLIDDHDLQPAAE